MANPNVEVDADQNNQNTTPVKFDIIGKLLRDWNQIIFLRLTPEDLRSAVSCCSRWKDAMNYNYLWSMLCRREGYLGVEPSQRSEFCSKFLEKYIYWQGIFWYSYTLRQNWIKGHCKKVTLEIKEPDTNLPVWWFSDDVLVIRNDTKRKLSVINLKTPEFKRTDFSWRPEPDLGNGIFFKSGKYLTHFVKRGGITVWDYENEITVFDKVLSHTTNVQVFENLFIFETLNNDKFQVFNIESQQVEYEFKGKFGNWVIMDGKLVFLTQDHDINILNWDDKALVTLTCCPYRGRWLHKFLVKGDLLLSFCKHCESISNLTTSLCAWNIITKARLYSINLGNSFLNHASFLNNYLYLNYTQRRDDDDEEDNKLLERFELLDYTKGTVIASLTDLDTSVPISNDQFIIVARSNKLSLWCLKTRNIICDLNFPLHKYDILHNKMLVTNSKLFYAKRLCSDSLSLNLRDFEISDDES